MRVIFFDGVCSLCNGFIDFLIRRDGRGRLRFAPLQGSFASEQLSPELTKSMASIVFWVEGHSTWVESTAAIRAVAELGGPWRGVLVFLLVPTPLRNGVYRWVAQNRYEWFGRRETCRLPTPEEQQRFI